MNELSYDLRCLLSASVSKDGASTGIKSAASEEDITGGYVVICI